MANGVPAHDKFAEKVVVSSGVLEPDTLPELRRYVTEEDFYDVPCRDIWRAVVALDDAGSDIGLESVASWLQESGRLQGIGGPQALVEIIDATPAMAASHEYARTIAEKAAVRRVEAVCSRVGVEARGAIENASEWLCSAVGRISDAADLGTATERDPAETARVVAAEVHSGVLERARLARSGSVGAPGYSTGFSGLDYRIGRLSPCGVHILGAPPGIGKTGLALAISRNVASSGIGVAYATLEIPRDELLERALADLTRLKCDDLFAGRIRDEDQGVIARAVDKLAKLPMVIDDASTHSIASLRGLVRRSESKLGIPVGLLVVDYLQLVKANTRQNASETEVVSEVSKGLRALAKDLRVAVLALSQFNRDVRNRSDKEPQLTDLRQSGQIEQDARAIILLQRTSKDGEEPQMVSAFVRKARGGGHLGLTRLTFRRATSTWAEEAEEEPPAWQQSVDDRWIDDGF